MKKILFSFMSLFFLAVASNAQTGSISGTVVDANQNPVPGVAVLIYGSVTNHMSGGTIQVDPESAYQFAYTDQNGNYNLPWWVGAPDTLIVGVLDCQHNLTWGSASVSQANPNGSVNLQVGCVPALCDVFIWERSYPANNAYTYSAVPLRDSILSGTPAYLWTYGSVTRPGGNPQQMQQGYPDTIWVTGAQSPVCYQHTNNCNAVCMGSTLPPALACNADFYVDSANSINSQGQVVVWENSTTDSGATIIGYRWDFGDGSPTVNQQYPIHTYSDTGLYQVCLTITAVKQTAIGMDTCASTSCDTIGFDSNGNLIYKSSGGAGFTINVVDPATVGQSEMNLESEFNLFPNPTRDEATLAWDASIGVEQIDVLSINGQLIRSIDPNTSSVKLTGLETGVYILRVKSEKGEAAVRMMVQ